MKIAASIIFAFVCLGLVHANIWDYCPGNIDATFNITTLTLTPNPPVIGAKASVSLVGTVLDEITAGHSQFQVQYYIAGGWHTVLNLGSDVCKVINCPVQEGPFTFNTAINVPFITPKGSYRGTLLMTDQNNRNITCLTFATQM